MFKKFLLTLLGLLFGFGLFLIGLLAIAVLVTYPKLPALDAVEYYKPKMPLVIYSADNKVIGQYGEERRIFTKIGNFPKVLKDAVIAAEDKNFYQHNGVDFFGVMRALISNLTGGVRSGASTITQQVARNFYLTNERTLTRKFNEALLAYKMEQTLTKDQILELYFNQIYLGQHAYGFATAAQVYFNKPVQSLTLPEAAILAGLPKAPSAFNPIVNPKRAKIRQGYVLGRMLELGMISKEEYDAARVQNLHYASAKNPINPNALYVAEMVRREMYERYGDAAYTEGFRVYTTIKSGEQTAATYALRKALLQYDSKTHYRGAENWFDLSGIAHDNLDDYLERQLANYTSVSDMLPAIVTQLPKNKIIVYLSGVGEVGISGASYNWVKGAIGNNKMGDRAIRIGSLIWVQQRKNQTYAIVQQPELQGALVALDTHTGAVRALVGGFDFQSRAFNRATQAYRQPGSSFKPFIYSAAISRGVTPATLVNDAPLSLLGLGEGGGAWNPKNSDGRYDGFIPVRQALAASKNMVSIRLLMAIGMPYTRDYLQRFGFAGKQVPNNLSIALGSLTVTPMQMAEGFAVFANGGYKISHYLIDKIYDANGQLRAQMQPFQAAQNAPLVIDPRNAYLMYSLLQGVIRSGTGSRANALGRTDLAGKTGTTNQNKDAWFVGFNPNVVSAVYIGFDKPKSMGRSAFGGALALPVWIDYMRHALKGVPNAAMPIPKGVVQINGEYFLNEYTETNPDLSLEKPVDVPIDNIDIEQQPETDLMNLLPADVRSVYD